jgi:competence CoiA-like predicted nuclease
VRPLSIAGLCFFIHTIMIYGLLNGEKIEASPEVKNAKCQCCNSDLIAKCGDIKIWHFAHKTKNECSSWWKPMTEWHKNWQEQFPKNCREVVHKCQETGEKHIADVKIQIAGKELVIEFQNSPISKKEIKSRDLFYKDIIWVLNGEKYEFYQSEHTRNYSLCANDNKIYQVFENGNISLCKICRSTDYDEIYKYLKYQSLKFTHNNFIYLTDKPIYIDFGNGKMGYIKWLNLRPVHYQSYSNTVTLLSYDTYHIIVEITKEQFLDKFAQHQ